MYSEAKYEKAQMMGNFFDLFNPDHENLLKGDHSK